MQTLVFYVSAASTLGAVRDYANAKAGSLPILTRSVGAILKMRVFSSQDTPDAYPLEELSAIPSWQWVMDTDFDSSTGYVLVADHNNIRVSRVSENINGRECVFTEFSIPVPDMNTQELCDLLDTKESIATLNGELVGYDTNGEEVFVLQVKGFTVRNRISATGNPTEIESEYLNGVQVRAICSSGLELIFAKDASEVSGDWHEEQRVDDRYFRVRMRGDTRIWDVGNAEDSGWSDFILIPAGKDGEDGDAGATFTPAISEEGVLSWTNNGGLENPSPVNIKGNPGNIGPQGPAGAAAVSWAVLTSVSDSNSFSGTAQVVGSDGTMGETVEVVFGFEVN